jgi:hypothetical protein
MYSRFWCWRGLLPQQPATLRDERRKVIAASVCITRLEGGKACARRVSTMKLLDCCKVLRVLMRMYCTGSRDDVAGGELN